MGNYHEGGSEFDFKSLDEAAYYIQDNCRRWARMGIWTKEKYGTLRVSTTCACTTQYDMIHTLIYPGHVYYRLPRWFRTYVDWPFGQVLNAVGIVKLIQKYQRFTLKYFWKRAAKKWPHISKEILDEYEWTVGDEA